MIKWIAVGRFKLAIGRIANGDAPYGLRRSKPWHWNRGNIATFNVGRWGFMFTTSKKGYRWWL
jgi:hypothetical protein